MDRGRWALVVGAAFCFFGLATALLGLSGGEYDFCGGFGYCWVTVDLMSLSAMTFLPFAVGWLWLSKARGESSEQHAGRFNDFMTINFSAATLCVLWIVQLTINPTTSPLPSFKGGIYSYVLQKQGDIRMFLIESCATFLAVILVGFWTVRRSAETGTAIT